METKVEINDQVSLCLDIPKKMTSAEALGFFRNVSKGIERFNAPLEFKKEAKTGNGRHNAPYSPSEIEAIKKYHKKGWKLKKIARKLGRTEGAVSAMKHSLGLNGNKGK